MKFVLCKNVKVVKVPHLKTLTIDKIYHFASNSLNTNKYLPDYSYDKRPYQRMVLKFGYFTFLLYILIIVHTLKEKEFTDFIIKAQNDREKYAIMKKQLVVKFVPAIAQIIKQSCQISSKF